MNMQYQRIKNLFLQQSYLDAWEDYARSLRKPSFIKWDYLVLTASNEEQADGYRAQIQQRLAAHQLPEQTEYVVLPDPDGKRVGSGGATLNVLRCIAERENETGMERDQNPFAGKRILVIHSGGDSRRVPQYSACGKLFSPVPRELPDGRLSTLFDEMVIGMSGLPSRIKDGMLVMSGDVLLLFNPLQIDFQFHGAAGITMKKPVSTGKNHGVYLNDGHNYVRQFLHKQTEESLRAVGAVDDQNAVDLDTGAVLFDSELLAALYGLVCIDGKLDVGKFVRFVNETVRISFYGDFLYPLAGDSTLEEYYRQAPEGCFSEKLLACRTEIWETLHKFSMRLFPVSPAEFIHFGTTRELLQLVTETIDSFEFLGWKRSVMSLHKERGSFAAHNSIVDANATIGERAYFENSVVGSECSVGEEVILSEVELIDEKVPADCVLSGVWLKDGNCVVRIYGISDNPKNTFDGSAPFLCTDIREFLKRNNLGKEDIWKGSEENIWFANLYPVGKNMREAVRYALLVYRMAEGTASPEEIEEWKAARRESLQSSFMFADVRYAMEWKSGLRDRILTGRFADALISGQDYLDAVEVFGEDGISQGQYVLLLEAAKRYDFYDRIKILYSLSRYMKAQNRCYNGTTYDKIETFCFREIQDNVCAGGSANDLNTADVSHRIQKESVHVELPVRVNWGGGWTDTPPYCNEHGGVVLNAAIKLNGILPVQVSMRKLKELHVEFESQDVGAYGVVDEIEEIRNCSDPFDAFALHKAALLTYGIIPSAGEQTLEVVLKKLGGGIYLSTQVVGVPKGSGLGTSSILSGACIKAIAEFVGETLTDNEVYEKVLCMEQAMSTGGGWQDQVGGITPGIKFITTEPGLRQDIHVTAVGLSNQTKAELQDRFALIYTGQRRLARNLLRKVIGGYLSGRRKSIDALHQMPELAVLMRFELERGNIDAFAELLNRHWEISKQLDSGSTNTCIDQIFLACDDLISGKFIAGAGGGGFLMVVLKKGISKEMLSRRLHEVFQDSGADVWNSEFIWN